MNLQALRNQIKNITDYSPTQKGYENQLDELINEAYFSLWRSKLWNFATKEMFYNLYPDLNATQPGNDGSPITVTYANGQRIVIFSSAMMIFDTKEARKVYEGNIIELHNRQYTILKIISNTSLAVSEPIRTHDNSASIVGSTDWFIKVHYHRLPEDCIEILSLAHRDVPYPGRGAFPPAGKIRALPARHDVAYSLREDFSTYYAEYYIPMSPLQVPPGEKFEIEFEVVEGSSGEGDLVDETYYEFCWAFMGPDGAVGPLSEPQIVQVPEDEAHTPQKGTFTFLTFDDQVIENPASAYNSGPGTKRPYEGLRKVIYYNSNFDHTTGRRLGLPRWTQLRIGYNTNILIPVTTTVNQDDPLIAEDTEGSIEITNKNSMGPGQPEYVEYDGQHLRYRLHPRPNTFDFSYEYTSTSFITPRIEQDYFRRIELRYQRKPKKLVTDTDGPEMPYEFHNLIVYKAVEDILMKNGDAQSANYYAKKYEKLLRDLEKRYIDHVDMEWQKAQFGYGVTNPMRPDWTSLRKLN